MASIKRALGDYAIAHFLPKKGKIGLGTGTTAHEFMRSLGNKWKTIDYQQKRNFSFIATSKSTLEYAQSMKLPMIDDSKWTERLDITFDGADHVDIFSGVVVKGLGGALLREKIVAFSSDRVILMIEDRKIVNSEKISSMTIPLEIETFGSEMTLKEINHMLGRNGYEAIAGFRYNDSFHRFVTENGNYTIDISIKIRSSDLKKLDEQLHKIPGVLQTGIFINLATDVIIAYPDHRIEHFSLLKLK
jgi:ribose 5-phosphate isomerase A